jgi:hypothetical protein
MRLLTHNGFEQNTLEQSIIEQNTLDQKSTAPAAFEQKIQCLQKQNRTGSFYSLSCQKSIE